MSQLIGQLIEEGVLKTLRIISAFQKINRADFMLKEFQDEAEGNYPLSIGYGQTISQPFTVAFMLELLQPKSGGKILDIGSGSGWTTALLAEIVGPKGQVFAIERISELKEFGEANVKKYNFPSSEGEQALARLQGRGKKSRVQFFCSDGSRGLKDYAPFDRILVSASAAHIPQELLTQLKIGGRLVIPVGRKSQDIAMVEKLGENKYKEKRYPGFIFVPLISD